MSAAPDDLPLPHGDAPGPLSAPGVGGYMRTIDGLPCAVATEHAPDVVHLSASFFDPGMRAAALARVHLQLALVMPDTPDTLVGRTVRDVDGTAIGALGRWSAVDVGAARMIRFPIVAMVPRTAPSPAEPRARCTRDAAAASAFVALSIFTCASIVAAALGVEAWRGVVIGAMAVFAAVAAASVWRRTSR